MSGNRSSKAATGADAAKNARLTLFLGNEQFNQLRVGAHLTGMKLGTAEVTFAAGYLAQSNVGSGAYGSIEMDYRF
jgi:hypothetical protein